jgi:hypothetical protein
MKTLFSSLSLKSIFTMDAGSLMDDAISRLRNLVSWTWILKITVWTGHPDRGYTNT